jgi:hypothetical protein
MNKQHIIIAYILGAITLAFIYHAYNFYTLRQKVFQNEIVLAQIVQLINASQKQ